MHALRRFRSERLYHITGMLLFRSNLTCPFLVMFSFGILFYTLFLFLGCMKKALAADNT